MLGGGSNHVFALFEFSQRVDAGVGHRKLFLEYVGVRENEGGHARGGLVPLIGRVGFLALRWKYPKNTGQAVADVLLADPKPCDGLQLHRQRFGRFRNDVILGQGFLSASQRGHQLYRSSLGPDIVLVRLRDDPVAKPTLFENTEDFGGRGCSQLLGINGGCSNMRNAASHAFTRIL